MSGFSDANGHVQMVCAHCGKGFRSYPSHAGLRKYCSRACYWEARRDRDTDGFWRRVEKGDGCWLWRGAIGSKGYGQVMTRDGRRLAHRVMYELTRGPIPEGLFVCHHCDNPRCVNPEHLFLGTLQDNVADMVAKGRQAKGDRAIPKTILRGERNPNARLTQAQVDEVRALYATGGYSQKELARRFGIGKSNINVILRGETWKR